MIRVFFFLADDETVTYRSSSSKDDKRKAKRIGKKLFCRKRSSNNNSDNVCSTRINLSTSMAARNNENLVSTEITSSSNDSSWSHFTDEDYIVFCFREDGAFDVVKDYCKSETPCASRRSSLPPNQKVSKKFHYSLRKWQPSC